MNNATKFIIFVLLIVAIAFGYKAYQAGAFENASAVKTESPNPIENSVE